MLVFIIPLQSPEASRNWDRVSALCCRTVQSVCSQDSDDFRAILVCNRAPNGLPDHPALTIIEGDFPIPEPNTDSRMRDKTLKIARGLVHARPWAPFHCMMVDADDCVSRQLASFIKKNPSTAGWFLETGYVHDQGSSWLYRKRPFHTLCGTSHIIRVEENDLPFSMADSDYWILNHGIGEIVSFMNQRGTPLQPLPFVGAIYNTDTGENDSGMALRLWRSRRILLSKILCSRPLTPKIRREFGLTPLPVKYS